jgi:hypothetical protein
LEQGRTGGRLIREIGRNMISMRGRQNRETRRNTVEDGRKVKEGVR